MKAISIQKGVFKISIKSLFVTDFKIFWFYFNKQEQFSHRAVVIITVILIKI